MSTPPVADSSTLESRDRHLKTISAGVLPLERVVKPYI